LPRAAKDGSPAPSPRFASPRGSVTAGHVSAYPLLGPRASRDQLNPALLVELEGLVKQIETPTQYLSSLVSSPSRRPSSAAPSDESRRVSIVIKPSGAVDRASSPRGSVVQESGGVGAEGGGMLPSLADPMGRGWAQRSSITPSGGHRSSSIKVIKQPPAEGEEQQVEGGQEASSLPRPIGLVVGQRSVGSHRGSHLGRVRFSRQSVSSGEADGLPEL
jgi:hypothetical protein